MRLFVCIYGYANCSTQGTTYNHTMPIFRGFILLLAIWLAFVLARQLYRSYRLDQTNAKSPSDISPSLDYTNTVACDTCRTHVPKTEAIHKDGRYFCSQACAAQHTSQP